MLLIGVNPVLADQTGLAVEDGGRWKVAAYGDDLDGISWARGASADPPT
ncbi:hypothetical protein OG874_15170 [Nocardia sp. NBC_00565]|nr:hypothetical protein [Nocardia sp. NBC_00565]WUC06390.1 hypothetical protein OG874_15170 [Nocardia sp. NBC_00565]